MDVRYDKQEQFEKIQAGLLNNEVIWAVFDCTGVGTGFVGATNLRIIVQDNSFAGKKSAVTSIPYRNIQSVSFVSDKSMFGKFYSSSTIAIVVGGVTTEATFRGEEKAKYIHDAILTCILR